MIDRDKTEDLLRLERAFFENLTIVPFEFGGIGLDPKRPFGNSDVEADILEIIGWDMEGDDGHERCYASYQREYARDLYHQDLLFHLRHRYPE